MTVDRRTKDFFIDTGSPVSFIAQGSLHDWLSDKALQLTKAAIGAVTGHSLKVLGEVWIETSSGGQCKSVPINLLLTDRGPSICPRIGQSACI